MDTLSGSGYATLTILIFITYLHTMCTYPKQPGTCIIAILIQIRWRTVSFQPPSLSQRHGQTLGTSWPDLSISPGVASSELISIWLYLVHIHVLNPCSISSRFYKIIPYTTLYNYFIYHPSCTFSCSSSIFILSPLPLGWLFWHSAAVSMTFGHSGRWDEPRCVIDHFQIG